MELTNPTMPNLDKEIYQWAVKKAIKKKIVSSLMALIVSKLPFLGLKFLNPIVGFLIEKIVEFIFEQTELAVAFMFIDMRTTLQGQNFTSAAIRYEKNKTPENEKLLNESLKALVNFNGS